MVAFDVSEAVTAGEWLRNAAAQAEESLAVPFQMWAEATADVMRGEIPVDQGDMRDSVTVEYDGLSATIGPTNTDDHGRPVGFFVNYGAGNRPPNDFIGRTAAQSREGAGEFDVSAAL